MKKTKNKASPQTVSEASKMAKATQRAGQTKEQTKLIAQGIQKGIEHYKSQQKIKARELDKKLRKVRDSQSKLSQLADAEQNSALHKDQSSTVAKSPGRLPWTLLLLSWLFFVLYFSLFQGE